MIPLIPLKFIYTQRPSITITIPWESADTWLAARAYEQAQRQGIVLACAWHPPTDSHHRWHRQSPLLSRWMPNYDDYFSMEQLGIHR